jgi:hypothetical protein
MKTKIILAAAFSSLLLSAKAQKIKEIGGFQNPESVIAHKDQLFVSNTGEKLDPIAKDGDGYITMLNREDGKVIEQKFISGLNSPKGMYIKCGVLYIADIDKIVGYNIKTKKKVFEADLSKFGVTYANDLARAHGGFYVSATLNDAVYKVCKKKAKVKQLKIKGDVKGANGLFRKPGGRLYVANYGRADQPDGGFGRIKRCHKKYVEFHKGGIYDGIVKYKGRLLVTDWVNSAESKGRLVAYKHCKKKFTEINLGRTIDGPSDIYKDKKHRVLWIPAMKENKILSVSFDELTK